MFENLNFCSSVTLRIKNFATRVRLLLTSCFYNSAFDCRGCTIIVRCQNTWLYFWGRSINYDWLPSCSEKVHTLVSSVYEYSVFVKLLNTWNSSKISSWFPVEFLKESFSNCSKVMSKLVLEKHSGWRASLVFGISKWFVDDIMSHYF